MVDPMTDERLAEIRERTKSKVIQVGDPYEVIITLAADAGGLLDEVDRLRAALAEIRRLDEWSADTSAWPGWNVWPMIRAVYNDALGADR